MAPPKPVVRPADRPIGRRTVSSKTLGHDQAGRWSGMARISYVDPETVEDPEIRGYLEHARRHGTPRPESQAIRAHNPAVIRAFSQAWELTFRNGVLDHRIKELCRVYVSQSIDCHYCGLQRSVQAGQQGLTEERYDELLD